MRQVLSGQSLEHDGGGDIGPDPVWHLHEAFGRNDDLFGISAQDPGEGNSIPGLDEPGPGVHRGDDPGPFLTDHKGKRNRIEAGALIHVDEIDPARLEFDDRLPGAGHRVGQLHPLENVTPTGRRHLYRLHEATVPALVQATSGRFRGPVPC